MSGEALIQRVEQADDFARRLFALFGEITAANGTVRIEQWEDGETEIMIEVYPVGDAPSTGIGFQAVRLVGGRWQVDD